MTDQLNSSRALDVADFFLANADPDDLITHLKLQKLCAYAKAFSLAILDQPLFNEPLEAWMHGPVVRRIYEEYRANGKNPITTTTSADESRQGFDETELYVLETVNSYYGAYAAPRLRNMSHDDFPGDFESHSKNVIPDDEIRARFLQNKVVLAIKDAANE
ncbi:MAG: DUF4065 domain-containing protein [Desulfovibrionaceae bacterium]|nr:DUF4065 domain-containing protein [Desulfovibrionaceae bacterium]